MNVRQQTATIAVCFAIVAIVALAAPACARAQGAAITPEMAKVLFDQIAPLRAEDQCVLASFQTERFVIDARFRSADGAVHSLAISTGPLDGAETKQIAGWTVSAPKQLATTCSATLAAIESILEGTPSPSTAPWKRGRWTSVRQNYPWLAAQFLLLITWTAWLVRREARRAPPPRRALLTLAAICAGGLALRLSLSPRTFLHEYYHVADTLASHLQGIAGPVYGDTGPALYQLSAWLRGDPTDPNAIFATNLILATLAIPAIAAAALAIYERWSAALCAAALLAVFPQHLRFSASEVLFIPATTFALWSAAATFLFLRTRSVGDGIYAALATSIALQCRPEMTFFPIALAMLVLVTEPRSLGVLATRAGIIATIVLATLLVPRFLELSQILQSEQIPTHHLPAPLLLRHSLVLLDSTITPPLHIAAFLTGAAWAARWRPGVVPWATAVWLGFSAYSLATGNNPPYNQRAQLLPNVLALLLAGAAGPLAADVLRNRSWRRAAIAIFTLLAVVTVTTHSGYVTYIADQQLEWSFLSQTVPQLPRNGALLTNTSNHANLDPFPRLLLQRHGKQLELIDLSVAQKTKQWPQPGTHLLFYKGMYCHADFHEAPPPAPMTSACNEVYRRYQLRPLAVTELHTTGYSALRYASPPFEIGFFVLEAKN